MQKSSSRVGLWGCCLAVLVASGCGGSSSRGPGSDQDAGHAGAEAQTGNSGATAAAGVENAGAAGSSAGAGETAGTVSSGGVDGLAGSGAQTSEGGAAGSSEGPGGAGSGNDAGANNGGSSGTVSVPVDPSKLDLLLVIDNSLSMGDKQAVLASTVPDLLKRLVSPDCVSTNDSATDPMSMDDPRASCPSGYEREFPPYADLHLGVITTSLGDFGGDVCPEDDTPENLAQNDHAWLLGALPRTGLADEFLTWAPSDSQGGAAALTSQTYAFAAQVLAADELGCGLEMTFEALYRFLIDPVPPADVVHVDQANESSDIQRSGLDSNILTQRAAFLRPDSRVAIVMVSDENDCSLRDSGFAWLMARAYSGANRLLLKPGTAACDTDPNDPCCYSCYAAAARPAGCPDETERCSATLTVEQDSVGLRCWDQKRRFGHDFLFPVSRYVNALTLPELCPDQTLGDLDCSCDGGLDGCSAGNRRLPNPLYRTEAMALERGPSDVFLTAIVGVPWQDLATSDSLDSGVPLHYQSAAEIDWGLLLPGADGTVPGDPLMIESPEARAGTQPITGEPLASPDAGYYANSINGHEWNTSNEDLQFACIFGSLWVNDPPLPRDCNISCDDTDNVCKRRTRGCGCGPQDDPPNSLSPLCQNPSGGYSSLQYSSKAYPGIRPLQLLHDFALASGTSHAVAASICPKDLDPSHQGTRGYGYNPAFQALLEQLQN